MAHRFSRLWLLLQLITSIAAADSQPQFVRVNTQQGLLKGLVVNEELHGSRTYYSFRGVPFAQPPTEQLRFQPPVEVAAHDGELDATEDGNFCPQFDLSSGKPVGDENCLNLNIYTPGLDGKQRPVVVFLHGGAFIMGGGASALFSPAYFIDQDIVMVSPNYRLGALGFLATNDGASAGNMALLDQIMALKWLKQNAHHFGGDANQVTLVGDDAGATAATILALSSQAKGLFHAVVALSGNAVCDQLFQKKPHDAAVQLATNLGCSTSSGADIVDCLRRQTQQSIVTETNKMFTFFSYPRWFAPVVDGKVLTAEPEALLAEGRVADLPFLLGQTKDEGASLYRLTLNSMNNGNYDDNFVDHKLPRLLPLVSDFSSKLYPITRNIRKRYFVNVDLDSEDQFRPKYVEMLTDLLYTRCTDKFARHLVNHSRTVHQFVLAYRGQYSIVNLQGESVDMGVAHGDLIQYLFPDVWGDEMPMSPSDIKFSKNVFSSMVTNFAKSRNPASDLEGVRWAARTKQEAPVLIVGDKLSVDQHFREDILKFWNEDIPKLVSKKQTGTADSSKKSGKSEL